MMAIAVVLSWLGVLLAGGHLFAVRANVTHRLGPFVAGDAPQAARVGSGLVSVFAMVRALTTAKDNGDVAVRLAHAGMPLTARQFRRVQLVCAGGGLLVVAVVGVVVRLPPAWVLGVMLAGPSAMWWVSERWVTVKINRRRQHIARELPVVIDQLAGLMKNGVGVVEAAADVAQHTGGVVAADLGRIAREAAHGVPVEVALQAWADRHDVAELRRIVAVLDTHRHAHELGRLLADEVRELRLNTHRELLQVIQQREQQVWIPVTVATLVPGVLLLSVPFWHTLSAVLG